MKKILTTILKTLLLLVAMGYMVFALVKVSRSPQEMICTGVEYQFTDSGQVCLIDRSGIEAILAQHKISPKGQILADINIGDIERYVAASPYVDSVLCYHTASGKLCIRVMPLHPMFHVLDEDGNEYYVTADGQAMPGGKLGADVLVVTGHVDRGFATSHLVNVCRYITEDAYWDDLTEQIYIDRHNNIEIIPRFTGQRIQLGDYKDVEDKLRRVRLFYEKGMAKTGWDKYNVVSAAYKGQIICKKEKR